MGGWSWQCWEVVVVVPDTLHANWICSWGGMRMRRRGVSRWEGVWVE